MEPLKKSKSFPGPEGPVVLAILDGVGIGKYEEGDMVRKANTPTLDWPQRHRVWPGFRAGSQPCQSCHRRKDPLRRSGLERIDCQCQHSQFQASFYRSAVKRQCPQPH